jgi:hypothetical protein
MCSTTLTIPHVGIISIEDFIAKPLTWWHTSLTEVMIANKQWCGIGT